MTNGIYFDGFIPNTSASPGAALVDGIIFNGPATTSSSGGSDGIISFQVTSGTVNNYAFNDFPSSPPSSLAFASAMDAGGTFEFGNGNGTVTISGLTVGHSYTVQVFNYANDGDPGLTTLSGSTPVTLGNLPGLAGTGTYGEFTTGTFTATNSSEAFNWAGAGSTYTVLGAISVEDTTVTVTVSPSLLVYSGDSVTLDAHVAPTQSINYAWLTDNGSGGANLEERHFPARQIPPTISTPARWPWVPTNTKWPSAIAPSI